MESIKKFFSKLQSSDEATRRRWLVILSGTSMAIVLALWISYINLIVEPVGREEKTAARKIEPGFAEVMKAGLTVVAKGLKGVASGALANIRTTVSSTNQIKVNLLERNFIDEELPEIKPVVLP